jgi:hypothetical protein
MLVKLFGIFATLLPARYRGQFLGDGNLDLRHGAIISAISQFVLCGVLLWLRYPVFLRARVAEAVAQVGDKPVGAFVAFAAGVLSVFQYIVNPVSLLLLYFMVEGGVRIFASVANGEVLPTLPLQLLAWTHDYATFRYKEHSLGRRISDVVQPGVPGMYDLKIESCRPKLWNRLTTIGWNDEFYELDREEQGPPPRPYIYLLKKRPQGKVIRGLHHYHPEEVLPKPGWAPLSANSTTKNTKEHERVPL